MGLKKGQCGNPNGRPKGKPNKTTKTAREWLNNLINKNRKQIEADLKALDPKDRLLVLEKFMSYTVPKLKESQVSVEMLSESDLDAVISEITKNIESE